MKLRQLEAKLVRWEQRRDIFEKVRTRTMLATWLFLMFCAVSMARSDQTTTALYVGRLATIDQDKAGTISRGADLFIARFVVSVPANNGLRLAGRLDVSSLAAIDPSNLDLSTIRTAEGYLALSWSAHLGSFEVGPALSTGALAPLENGTPIGYQTLYAGGLRLGRGYSWVYALAGKDGAADAAASYQGQGPTRFITAGSLELSRFAVIWDYVSGPGGRKRAGLMFRLPMPGFLQ